MYIKVTEATCIHYTLAYPVVLSKMLTNIIRPGNRQSHTTILSMDHGYYTRWLIKNPCALVNDLSKERTHFVPFRFSFDVI